MSITVKRFTCKVCDEPIKRVVSTSTGERRWKHAWGSAHHHEPLPKEGTDDATTEGLDSDPGR